MVVSLLGLGVSVPLPFFPLSSCFITLHYNKGGKRNTNRNHQSLKKGNSCKIIGMNVC